MLHYSRFKFDRSLVFPPAAFLTDTKPLKLCVWVRTTQEWEKHKRKWSKKQQINRLRYTCTQHNTTQHSESVFNSKSRTTGRNRYNMAKAARWNRQQHFACVCECKMFHNIRFAHRFSLFFLLLFGVSKTSV